MKKIIFLGLLILSGCFSGFVMNLSEKDVHSKINLVPNYSFENGNYNYNSIPDKWLIMNKPKGVVFWDKDTSQEGEKSLKIEHPSKSVKIISDSFIIDPGAIYYITAYVKSDKVTSKQVTINFFVFNIEGKKVNIFKKKFYIENKWTKLSLTSGFFKSSAKFARVIITIPRKTDNTFWIDNVGVYSVHSFMKRK